MLHIAHSSFITGAPGPSDSHLCGVGVRRYVFISITYDDVSSPVTDVQACCVCSPHASRSFWSDLSGSAVFIPLYFLASQSYFS